MITRGHMSRGCPGVRHNDLVGRLRHSPYSSDLAPSDYHFFSSLDNHLRDKSFTNEAEVRQAITDFFASHSPEFYRKGIGQLETRVPGNEAADELAGRGCDVSKPSSSVWGHSEVHSLHRDKMNWTWRNPPAHHRYAAKSSGLSLHCRRTRALQTASTRFKSGYLRDMTFVQGGRGQEPTDFIYDLLKVYKKLGLEMSEEALVEHIFARLEPQVQDYVEIRNPTTTAQLLQVMTKFKERYFCKEMQAELEKPGLAPS
ncbi:uncharacterized protein TNCV_2511691 [Trichonephila clavipes]|nr:uncharacterized protein TNCV_2511691 [Trichonephila clavipes]